MDKVFDIFKSIQSTTKRTEKISILEKNRSNALFKMTLRWLLNPFEVTGISAKKLSKAVSYDTAPIQTWGDMMIYLSENHTGRDTDIAIVQGFIRLQPEEYREYYKQLITKSLKLGIDAKTVNAVYGNGFVPSCEIQLANKYFEHPEKVTGEFTLTEKLDGYRTACLVHDDKIELFSRQGQPMEGFVEVEQDMKAFLAMNKIHNAFFDGELVAVNCEDLTSAENYKIVTTIARKKGIKSGLKYMIFDTLRYEDFIEQTCDTEYWKRRKLLERIFDNVKLDHVCLLPVLYQGVDKSMIMKYLNEARDKHKEGIMINLDDKPYEFKRTNNLLKVKVMQDADLKIIDVYEGTGKNVNKLGGIIVEFIYNGKHYQCECGSGFSDEERVDFWDNPAKIIGKIATIQFFEISKNDDGGFGLRFPVWIHRIRDDKTEISMN